VEPLAYETMHALQEKHWWWRGMRRLYQGTLRHFQPTAKGSVIDIGCGFGANLPVLSEQVAKDGILIGVDASLDALNAIPRRAGLMLVQAHADALPFRRDTFDTTALLAVIEHVDRDDRVLTESYRVTKVGGLQILLTSAFMLLWSHHDTANEHRRRYLGARLDQLQRAAGWRVLRTGYINAFIFPLVALVRLMQRRSSPPENAAYDMGPNPYPFNRVLEGLLRFEGWLLRCGIIMPFGVDLFSVAVRNHDPQ
jgi:ubiquinone/menaquinone biosynthesis C-methylase UbiE